MNSSIYLNIFKNFFCRFSLIFYNYSKNNNKKKIKKKKIPEDDFLQPDLKPQAKIRLL